VAQSNSLLLQSSRYDRQNVGVNRTKMVMTSKRPISIAAVQTQV